MTGCIAAYPKTGSTWLRLILGNILSNQNGQRTPLDFHTVHDVIPDGHITQSSPSGLVKWHRPYDEQFFYFIHLLRDPGDVLVSLFYYLRDGLKVDIKKPDTLIEGYFEADTFPVHMGLVPYVGHTKSYEVIDKRRVVVTYEQLRDSPKRHIRRIIKFINEEQIMNLKWVTDDLVEWAVEEASFAKMRKSEVEKGRRFGNPEFLFTRNGGTEQWVDVFNPYDADKIYNIAFKSRLLKEYYGRP